MLNKCVGVPMISRQIKTELASIFLALLATQLFYCVCRADSLPVTDSMSSVSFNYHHIVDGDLDGTLQVDKSVLAASFELKPFFEKLFFIFSDIKHTQNLKIKICSDLRACIPSRYQPATNTIFIKSVEYNKPTKTNVGIIIATHEYTHRVFHSLMSDKITKFAEQFLASENKTLGDDEEKFISFLNYSYVPITELVADLTTAVFFSDANIMTIPVEDSFRGFQISYTEPDDLFFNSKVFGKSGFLIPNPYRMLVPLRNLTWTQCVPFVGDHSNETKKKIIMNVINRATALNRVLYLKAFGAGLTQEDLLNGIRGLCK